jgi:hypothetical protein
MFWMIVLLATSLAGLSCAVKNVSARPVTMQNLTVPGTALPTGCGLSPAAFVVDGNRVTGGLWAGLPISTNPWTGTARPVVASIRERMDGPIPAPDAPPVDRNAAARYRRQLTDGVEEAYAAVYGAQSDPNPVVVLALRFAPAEKPFYPLSDRRPSDRRIEIGQLHAVVSGNGGESSQAVEAYLKSLAG